MEKRNKFKILKRILPIICAVLVTATALITPIGAVVNSSQGGFNDYAITARSTFPMTVGFSYATRDLTTGAGASYVYSTYVGQYGVEYNKTKYGNEQYTLEYDPYGNSSTTYDVTGKLVYSLGAEEWGVSTEVETDSSYRLGRRRISMTNNTPESSNVAGLQQGVVLRADDIAFNPHTIVDSWELETTIVGGQTINRYVYTLKDEMDWSYSVPSFLTPTPLAYTNNLGIEMIYSWTARVVDNNGVSRSYSGTATYDNRVVGYQQELVPIMSGEALLGQIGGYGNGGQISDTVIIEDYYGYLEYKYYEYQAPQIEFTINGTTFACPDGITWGEYAYLDTTEYPASSNADVRWLDSTDGTGMQFNNNGTWQFILYNDEVVDNTDIIIGRAVYTLEQIPEDALAGTWFLNVDFVKVNDDERIPDYIVNGYYNGLNLSNDFENNLSFNKLTIAHWTISGQSKVNFNIYGDLQFVSTDLGFEEYVNVSQTYYSRYTNAGYITVNNGSTQYINPTSEDGINARRIIITSKLADVEDGNLLLSWLQANATKQGASTVAVVDEPTSASTDTPTTSAEGTWNEVERSESAEFVLYYPMIDTSGIRITNSEAYKAFYNRYSMPNMEKYINTMGIPIPSLEVDYTSWIGTAVGGFLNMELMPNFSLGGILAILIAFAITMLFLKFFAGG